MGRLRAKTSRITSVKYVVYFKLYVTLSGVSLKNFSLFEKPWNRKSPNVIFCIHIAAKRIS